MKNFRYTIILVLLSVIGFTASSQQGSKTMTLNYAVGIPAGNFKNLIDKTSFRGFEAAYLYNVTDQLALGLQVGYQDFYQKYPRQIFSETGYDLSAVITNSVQTIPVMIKAKYSLSNGGIQPFISLAAGGNLINYEKYYGEFVDSKNKFGFAAQPEAGLHIPFGAGKQSGFHIAAGYNYMPFAFNDAHGLSHFVLKAGVSIAVKE